MTVLESAAILDDIPVPPVNVNVSESSEIFSDPLSEEISSMVDIVFVLADVILPFESIVICGIAVVFPYTPAVTPVFASVPAIVIFVDPLKLSDPVISPEIAIVLAVFRVVAVEELPDNSPVNPVDTIDVAPDNVPERVAPFIVGVVRVLFVKVSVVSLPTRVSVLVGNVSVPVFTIVLILGVVRVLFVRVSVVVLPTRVSAPISGNVNSLEGEPCEFPVKVFGAFNIIY